MTAAEVTGAPASAMARFLALLRREYGSAAGYLEAQGAANSLPQRLEEALGLVGATSARVPISF